MMARSENTSRVRNLNHTASSTDSTSKQVGSKGQRVLKLQDELEHSQGRKQIKIKEEIDSESD